MTVATLTLHSIQQAALQMLESKDHWKKQVSREVMGLTFTLKLFGWVGSGCQIYLASVVKAA